MRTLALLVLGGVLCGYQTGCYDGHRDRDYRDRDDRGGVIIVPGPREGDRREGDRQFDDHPRDDRRDNH